MQIKPIVKTKQILMQETDKDFLIYDLKTDKVLCLNETSALVFKLCDGQHSVAEISGLMSQTLKMQVNEDFVRLALSELKRHKLLDHNHTLGNLFEGISRRELVKKVGLTSMVALPLISSIVAPSALMAQSGSTIPLFGACTTGGTPCVSGTACKTCIGCTASPVCCAGTDPVVNGPGAVLFCAPIVTGAACNAQALTDCCSGMGQTLGTTPSCPLTATCRCA